MPIREGEPRSMEKKNTTGKYPKSKFQYDEDADKYVCPAGQELVYSSKAKSRGQKYVRYRCRNCNGCELQSDCTKDRRGRAIKRYAGEELKEAMSEVFKDRRARKAYRRRKGMVEPVFAEMRERQGLKRFHRKGLKAVKVEFALHCMAYNFKRAQRIEMRAVLLVDSQESSFVMICLMCHIA